MLGITVVREVYYLRIDKWKKTLMKIGFVTLIVVSAQGTAKFKSINFLGKIQINS